MGSRTVPQTATKSATQLITGALWNAGPKALGDFVLGPPMFRGHQAATQTLASGAWTAMSLGATDVDTDTGHSNSVNNSRYTTQVQGWYWVEGYVAFQSGQPASRFESAIAKNGVIVPGSSQFLLRQNDLQALSAGCVVQLNVTDYVEVWGRQNSGGNLLTQAGTDLLPSMNAFWIHS